MKKFHVFASGIDAERAKLDNTAFDDAPHCHDKYEIFYVIEGHGRCVIEGVEYPIKPRTAFLFPPMTYHRIFIDDVENYDRASIFFDEGCVANTVSGILPKLESAKRGGAPVAFFRADAVSDQIAALVERFEVSDSFPPDERGSFLELLTSELILLISLASREKLSSEEEPLGLRVIRYLKEYPVKDINLDKLARHFFVSKYYLCRAFKEHNGISVRGYINQKRITYAKQLIDAGETASRAAYQVGYGDYSAFYRAYVKIVGKSPTEK